MSDLLAFEADRRAVNITINRYLDAGRYIFHGSLDLSYLLALVVVIMLQNFL